MVGGILALRRVKEFPFQTWFVYCDPIPGRPRILPAMKLCELSRLLFPLALLGASVLASAQAIPSQTGTDAKQARLTANDIRDMGELVKLKKSWTPIQRKIDSGLIFTAMMRRGQSITEHVRVLHPNIPVDETGRVTVDLDANVTSWLLQRLQLAGGVVVNSVPRFHAVRAQLPLSSLEAVAAFPEVRHIHREAIRRPRTGNKTTEGDVAHAANLTRSTYGLSGKGVRVGIISDGIDGLQNSQASGDVGEVSVLPGQQGGGSEGLAMLEIVHDLAPSAPLSFSSAGGSPAQFAANIIGLQQAGCKIICDDIGYLNESPFQDDIISQAVETVTANGSLYFTAAANDGRISAPGQPTGVWEGDFVASSTTAYEGTLHSWSGTNGSVTNAITGLAYGYVALNWADPIGGSDNDYDLFVLNSSGTIGEDSSVYDYSANTQDGNDDPLEIATYGALNQRVIVGKYKGADRFLYLNNFSGYMQYRTTGAIYGHSGAASAFSIAAASANGKTSRFTSTQQVEDFSSDGPRRVFFDASGGALTPGNFSATGGVVRNKPDFTAADGVTTTVPGFDPFYGTSAAAPHVAALAALMLEQNPALTTPTLKTLFQATALDLGPTGWDIDAGFGIIQTDVAARKQAQDSFTGVTLTPSTVSPGVASTLRISLSLQAPPSGLTFNLSSSDTAVATAPAKATVPAGATSVDVPVNAVAPGSAAIAASLPGGGTAKSATLTVTSNVTLGSLVVTPESTYIGSTAKVQGTLTLKKAAPAGGGTVVLKSSASSAASVSETIVVPAGKLKATFAITLGSVSATKTVTITAGSGSGAVSDTLTISPKGVKALAASPSQVIGGVSTTVKITLNEKAPAGGVTVALSSSTSTLKLPASVAIPAGKTSATVSATTSAVTATKSVTITANYRSTLTTTVTVLPAKLKSIARTPATGDVKGGTKVSLTVTLTGIAPSSAAKVGLSSSSVNVKAPATVKVAARATTATVSITTTKPTKKTAVTLTATYGGVTKTLKFNLIP